MELQLNKEYHYCDLMHLFSYSQLEGGTFGTPYIKRTNTSNLQVITILKHTKPECYHPKTVGHIAIHSLCVDSSVAELINCLNPLALISVAAIHEKTPQY